MAEESTNSRLETFCDGVFAIALTLLVLEIKTPVANGIHNANDLWHSLADLLPSVFAFVLSFAIIVISWQNHHGMMKLINKSTPKFIYANIFLLLTIVIIPFPTALFAEFGFTDAAAPAVVLYAFVMLLTNIGWILITRAALKPVVLAKNEKAKIAVENTMKQGVSAFILYSICTILAFWFPLVVAVILTLTWLAWLIVGLQYKEKI
jgi:uncharacterized membrane protein